MAKVSIVLIDLLVLNYAANIGCGHCLAEWCLWQSWMLAVTV